MIRNNKITLRRPSACPTDALFQELSATLLADEFRLLHELEGLTGPTGIDRAAVAAYVRMTMEAICLLFRRIEGSTSLQFKYKVTVRVQVKGAGLVPSMTASP